MVDPSEEVRSRADYATRLGRLHDREDDAYLRSLSPAQRMQMVWQMTLDAWAFKEGLADEPRLRRDVVRVVRRGS